MEIKYSIVIPHYNIPDLLQRCLNSIPCRNDIEIIVVDNKSKIENQRKAFAICNQFPNARYIQDSVGNGAGHARNIGISNSLGEWLIFADADDLFYPLFWDNVDSYIDKSPADIFYFKISSVYSDTLEPGGRNYDHLNFLIDEFLRKAPGSETSIRTSFPNPWGKVYSNAFVKRESLRFDEIPTSNDVMFSAYSGIKAESISACDCIMYVVTYREGSLIRLKDSTSLFCRFDALLRRNAFYRTVGLSDYNSLPIIPMWRTLKSFRVNDFFKYVYLLFKYKMSPFSGMRGVVKRKYIPKLIGYLHIE